jgi:hypothetical protein
MNGWLKGRIAAQTVRTDLVRCLLEKGINPYLVDANGKKPIDPVSTGGEAETEFRRLLPPREPEVVAAQEVSRQPGDCNCISVNAARRGIEELDRDTHNHQRDGTGSARRYVFHRHGK